MKGESPYLRLNRKLVNRLRVNEGLMNGITILKDESEMGESNKGESIKGESIKGELRIHYPSEK